MRILKVFKTLSVRLILLAALIVPLVAGFTTPALADDGGSGGVPYIR